jgi:predicted branched-subunit amino acid permease
MRWRRWLLPALPAALAIGVFGLIFGSVAYPVLGLGATLLSSLLIFSGSVQFAIAALLLTGAGTAAIVAGALTLNLRNLLLGAVLRPRIHASAVRRAGLAWFLTDESTGLALTSGEEAEKTLLGSGLLFYFSWQVGTALGLVGASLEGVADLAEAVFPVLFIGLTALACSSLNVALRALLAACMTGAAVAVAPDTGAVAAMGAAIVVSLPGRPS